MTSLSRKHAWMMAKDGFAGIGLIVFIAASFIVLGPVMQGLADAIRDWN